MNTRFLAELKCKYIFIFRKKKFNQFIFSIYIVIIYNIAIHYKNILVLLLTYHNKYKESKELLEKFLQLLTVNFKAAK